MAKFDNAKAIEKQKEIDAASNREQPQGEMTGVGRFLRKMGVMSDDYGTAANPSIVDRAQKAMFDKDVPMSKYWDTRKQIAGEMAAEQRREANRPTEADRPAFKKGGKVKASSASKRADGIAVKGKTRGRIV